MKVSNLLMIFIITLFIFPVTASAEWWNSDYSCRKAITLTGGASGVQTDYQLLLNITYDSDMQADFDDLRFANETHQIDTWLESKTDSTYADIWVEFPTTPENGVEQTYYMYYGKADAVADWDGDATFNFFDDFSNPNSRMTAADITRGETSYGYFDKGIDYLNNFSIDFTTSFTERVTGGALIGVFGLTNNTVGSMDSFGTTDISVFVHYDEGAGYGRIWLSRGNIVAYDRYQISLSNEYYCTLIRSIDSDSVDLEVYSDPDRTTLLTTLNVAGYGTNTKYRYIYGIHSQDNSQSYYGSAYVQDIHIDGEAKETLTDYTIVGSHIYVESSFDSSKWWGEDAKVVTTDGTCKVEKESDIETGHGSLICQNAFSSGVCTWKITETSACTAPFVVNAGLCYPSIQTTNRDIWYWQSCYVIATCDYTKARIRINDANLYESTPETRCSDEGRISIYFEEGYVKVIKDGVQKLEQTNATLTIPDGLKPFFGVGYDNVYTIADWVFVRKYAANPPTYGFGSEEEEQQSYKPPTPIDFIPNPSCTWANFSWSPGAGNITDSYNLSIEDVWHNGTVNTYFNQSYLDKRVVNIEIWGYNTSGNGNISNASLSGEILLPHSAQSPTNLQQTHGNYWANWTWDDSDDSYYIRDSYNVSINDTWYNDTTNQYYNHTGLNIGSASTITVYGYNNSVGLSLSYVSDSYAFPLYQAWVDTLQSLPEALTIAKDKFFSIIPFIISIILFAGFGLAIISIFGKLKRW